MCPIQDYWKRTHYGPSFNSDSGHFKHATLLGDFVLSTTVAVKPNTIYDQAGLMVGFVLTAVVLVCLVGPWFVSSSARLRQPWRTRILTATAAAATAAAAGSYQPLVLAQDLGRVRGGRPPLPPRRRRDQLRLLGLEHHGLPAGRGRGERGAGLSLRGSWGQQGSGQAAVQWGRVLPLKV